MCANWVDFYDPDSGIAAYKYGVGTKPGSTDVSDLIELSSMRYETCITLDSSNLLEHGKTYYNVIWAANGGLNQKNVSWVSNGGKFLTRLDTSNYSFVPKFHRIRMFSTCLMLNSQDT